MTNDKKQQTVRPAFTDDMDTEVFDALAVIVMGLVSVAALGLTGILIYAFAQ